MSKINKEKLKEAIERRSARAEKSDSWAITIADSSVTVALTEILRCLEESDD